MKFLNKLQHIQALARVKKQRGFTLIELLVVIAIIGILAGILFVAINPKEQADKANDAKRIVFMNQLQKALERYNLDHGYYPKFKYVHTVTSSGHDGSFENELNPYLKFDLNNPIFGPSDVNGNQFRYTSHSGDNYQSYAAMIILKDQKNNKLEQNDDGKWDWAYEVGQNPKYCSDNYSGNDALWWTTKTTRCEGGN